MKDDTEFSERVKRMLYGRDIAAPSVDAGKCTGCGLCVRACPVLVFGLAGKKAAAMHAERCIACGHCWAVCPEEAVFHDEAAAITGPKPGQGPAVAPDALELLVRERRSVRLFTGEAVSKEQLFQVIDAARYAPTGSNRQNLDYVVLSNPEEIAELRGLVEAFLNRIFKAVGNKAVAALLGLKIGRPNVDVLRYYAEAYGTLKERPGDHVHGILPFAPAVIAAHTASSDVLARLSAGAALYGCSLMAHSMGLGSCFLGFVQLGANEDKKIKAWLGIPKGNQCNGAMVVGHPDVTYRRLVERHQPSIAWGPARRA